MKTGQKASSRSRGAAPPRTGVLICAPSAEKLPEPKEVWGRGGEKTGAKPQGQMAGTTPEGQ
jgi:hypothetical protein